MNPKMMFRITPRQEGKDEYDMYIYDTVSAQGRFDWNTWTVLESETSAKFFREKLQEIPSGGTINLYINSNGGDAQEGVSIYNQLKRHGATVNGCVDGNAYSVAFLILMACDHKAMNLGTSALIHNMWITASGNASQLRRYADDLDKLMQSNRQIFLEACNYSISEEELIEMMDAETILTPDECLEYGFIDEVIRKQKDDDPEDNPDDNPDDDPEDNPDDNPDDDPEDNPDDNPEGNPDDEPEDNPDDDLEDDEKELMQMAQRMEFIRGRKQQRAQQKFHREVNLLSEKKSSQQKKYKNAGGFFKQFL